MEDSSPHSVGIVISLTGISHQAAVRKRKPEIDCSVECMDGGRRQRRKGGKEGKEKSCRKKGKGKKGKSYASKKIHGGNTVVRKTGESGRGGASHKLTFETVERESIKEMQKVQKRPIVPSNVSCPPRNISFGINKGAQAGIEKIQGSRTPWGRQRQFDIAGAEKGAKLAFMSAHRMIRKMQRRSASGVA